MIQSNGGGLGQISQNLSTLSPTSWFSFFSAEDSFQIQRDLRLSAKILLSFIFVINLEDKQKLGTRTREYHGKLVFQMYNCDKGVKWFILRWS